jgi:PIN domain nuclease of toxin-antitoxin system
MTQVVLDSSAVLASLLGEPGGSVALAAARNGSISGINFAEVVSKLIAVGGAEDQAVAAASAFGVEVSPIDERQAQLAGLLHSRTRRLGISMGDAFCLALASTLRVPVLTSNRHWASLDVGVEVQLIR